jgi:3-oxoacyl-[acyl-carrier protein] reductase
MTAGGRIAWIAGASSGIGEATAREFAIAGWRVGLGSRRLNLLDRITADLSVNERHAEALAGVKPMPSVHVCGALDVASPPSIHNWANLLRDRLGSPDLLVYCIGWGVFRKITETTDREWDETLSANLTGLFRITREVLPGMLTQGSGHFVIVLSVASRIAFPKNGAYAASKFGALGFTNVLRAETRRQGIRVTAVIPGATNTPFWDRMEGDWDRARMMSAAVVALAIRQAAESPSGSMIEEIEIAPQLGNL